MRDARNIKAMRTTLVNGKFLLLSPAISNFRKVWQPIDMTPVDMTPTRDSDAGVGHFTHSHQPSSGTLASHIKVPQIN